MIIEVRGVPAPQGNHRVSKGGHIYETSKAVGPWREAVRAETQRARNGAGHLYERDDPLWVLIEFRLPRPKGHYGTGRNAGRLKFSAPALPSGKPDIDKLARAVLDGLVAGGAFPDDSQVAQLDLYKTYGDPGCKIIVTNAKEVPWCRELLS